MIYFTSIMLYIISNILFWLPFCFAISPTSFPTEVKVPKGSTYIGERLLYNDPIYHWVDTPTNKINVFRKIPYALPPVGSKRFRPPTPIRNPQERIDTTPNAPLCPQPKQSKFKDFSISEDCLYLSVYTPEMQTEVFLPVMVFIHGGSFIANGAAVYNGAHLARYGVVVVIINYRLGILGFMTNGRMSMPGNYGLLDMILALQWIQANIPYFNGDPRQVTIVGDSAGGSAVGVLSVLPSAAELFIGTIEMSGPPAGFFGVYRLPDPANNFADAFRRLCELLSCPLPIKNGISFEDSRSMQCLREKDWSEYVTSNTMYDDRFTKLLGISNGAQWRIRIDGNLVPDDPVSLFSKGKFIMDRYMTGVTSNEVAHMVRDYISDAGKDILTQQELEITDRKGPSLKTMYALIKNALDYPLQSETKSYQTAYTNWSVTDNIREYSYMSSPISVPRKNEISDKTRLINYQSSLDFLNDYIMRSGTIQAARLASSKRDRFHGLPTFVYEFAYTPNDTNYIYNGGPHHEVDLEFLFGTPFEGKSLITGIVDSTQLGMDVSRLYMKLFTNFAKFGKPIWAFTYADRNYQYSTTKPQIIRIDEDGLKIRNEYERFFKRSREDLWMRKLYILQKEDNN